MNDWDTIEKMINTLPQWDIIKWIMGIQEELKCAKEDNLYQLRQNKNLQSKIDKVNEILNKLCIYGYEQVNCRPIKNTTRQEVYNAMYEIKSILKEDK